MSIVDSFSFKAGAQNKLHGTLQDCQYKHPFLIPDLTASATTEHHLHFLLRAHALLSAVSAIKAICLINSTLLSCNE